MKHLLSVAFALFALVLGMTAQSEQSAFSITGHGVATPFATDYQAIGINPANLDFGTGYEGKRFTMGFAEFGVSVYSGMLSKPDVRKNLFGGTFQDLSQQEQLQYAYDFANTNNAADIDIMWTGFSMNTEKLGSYAFSVRDKVDYYSHFGDQVAKLLWLGYTSPYFTDYVLSTGDTIPAYQNMSADSLALIIEGLNELNPQSISQLAQGTHFRMSWVREFNFAYGKRIINGESFSLNVGVGLKYLVGQGYLQLDAEDGKAEAFSSLSPIFDIDYSGIVDGNPSALPSDSKKLLPVGHGFGFDLGVSALIKNKLILSAAVTDIGTMTWDGNVYSLKDVNLTNFTTSGLDNLSLYDQLDQLNGSDGIVEWQGSQSLETKLAATMRAGAGLMLNDMLKFGVDFVAPLNDEVGSIENASIAVGGEFSPVKWVHLSVGLMNGGNYDTKIPAGVRFTLGKGTYEFGVASRDLVTFFTEEQPTVSAAAGFLRFRF
jgi:hypothetical protein